VLEKQPMLCLRFWLGYCTFFSVVYLCNTL